MSEPTTCPQPEALRFRICMAQTQKRQSRSVVEPWFLVRAYGEILVNVYLRSKVSRLLWLPCLGFASFGCFGGFRIQEHGIWGSNRLGPESESKRYKVEKRFVALLSPVCLFVEGCQGFICAVVWSRYRKVLSGLGFRLQCLNLRP